MAPRRTITTTTALCTATATTATIVLLALVAAMAARPAAAASLPKASCLAIFDVDRTLTGEQGSGGSSSGNNKCPDDRSFKNIIDSAYKSTGAFTLSDLGLKIASTKAGKNCYLGVITAGKLPNGLVDDEHKFIAYRLSSDNGNAKTPAYKDMKWADAKGSTPAPLLHSASPHAKYLAVPLIQKFYKQAGGVAIPDSAVWFFDDVEANVQPWGKNSGYNAHQISCDTRSVDPTQNPPLKYGIGKCGATAAEIDARIFKTGCSLCRSSSC